MPGGIARCMSVEDIQASLAWAQEQKVPLIVRSGGHNYAGYSTTEGLMIDVSQMKSFVASGRTLHLGAGVQNRDVYRELRPLNLAITHGRCLGVGVAGLVLGGGVGFNMRLHGLTCDQLVESSIVTADGQVLTLNESTNSDLFCACRGAAGGNFGIHTSFTFEAYPVSDLTMFNITWNTNLPEVYEATLLQMLSAPDELGIKITLTRAREGAPITLNLLGQLRGPQSQLESFLAPLRALANPSSETIRLVSYWDAQDLLSEAGDPEHYHERSRFADQPLSKAMQTRIFEMLSAWPGTSEGVGFKIFYGGGAVNRKSPSDTAYVHRNALMLCSVGLLWSDHDSVAKQVENFNWLDQFYNEISAVGQGAYQNFPDPALSNPLHAYYGTNLDRLRQVKRRYDPDNVFRYEQSIPPA